MMVEISLDYICKRDSASIRHLDIQKEQLIGRSCGFPVASQKCLCTCISINVQINIELERAYI